MSRKVTATRLLAAASLIVAAGTITSCGTDSAAPQTTDDVIVLTNGTGDQGIPVNGDNVGATLPDVPLDGPDGTTVASSSLLGTPLVLNFWFSLCTPCKRELPDFAAVAAQYQGKVRFVGINTADVDLGQKFATDLGVRYELLGDLNGRLISKLQINNFPVTVFVDASGAIVHQTGPITADELRATLDTMLR